MGLDFRTAIRISGEENRWEMPCQTVGAQMLKDLPNAMELTKAKIASHRAQILAEQNTGRLRTDYVKKWKSITPKKLLAQDGDLYICEYCPLLKALKDANSARSIFLGVTVASCDFRGKLIGSDNEWGDEITEEAYRNHTPEEMISFADRIEKRMEELRVEGLLTPDPYEAYSEEFDNDPWAKASGEVKMTPEQYAELPHWREQNGKRAIHWLRTCASFGVHMIADY